MRPMHLQKRSTAWLRDCVRIVALLLPKSPWRSREPHDPNLAMIRNWTFCVCLWLLAGCASMDATQPPGASNQHDPNRLVVVTLRNPASPSVPRAGSTVRGYDAPTAYSLAPATRASAKAIATAYRLRETDAWPIGLLGIH